MSLKALFSGHFPLIFLSMTFSYSLKVQTFVIMLMNTLFAFGKTFYKVTWKILSAIFDNKLDFTGHLNTESKKANLKLHALNWISRFLPLEQHVLIINAYIKSLFNCFPLVWIFCYRGIMHKRNKIHKPSLCLLLKNCKYDFQDLLRCSGDI